MRHLGWLIFVACSLHAAEPIPRWEKANIFLPHPLAPKDTRIVVGGGGDTTIANRPPLAGEWSPTTGGHLFTPKYPFKPGLSYRVYHGPTHTDLLLPKPPAVPPAKLVGLYPSATVLPENVFRFYVQFDRAMPRGDVYQYIAVLKADGKKVEQPFLEIDDELWNEEQTRLTLLIDPGRIKREVKPLLDLGPVFMAKNDYTLFIDGRWPTLDGTPLGKDFRRAIKIGLRFDGELDQTLWKVQPPTRQNPNVTVRFDRTMDYALLQRMLTVIDVKDNALAGTNVLGEGETTWTFKPTKPLNPGTYRVRINTTLEDTCGNAIGRAFEVDITAPPKPMPKRPAYVDLPFQVPAE